ncbi:MAG: sulfatase-like hydrolase/transferase [Planctomycetes bacterium]|nr:sulfatase-like hydrolase/transferase [Planctomycetota bacterium]
MVLGRPRSAALWEYFGLTYLLLLVNAAGYLWHIKYHGALTVAFAAAVFLTYCLVYMLPVAVPGLLLDKALDWSGKEQRAGGASVRSGIIYTLAVLAAVALQVFIFADRFIYSYWDHHIDGYVLNLLQTRGGIDSMGGDTKSTLTFALEIAGIAAIQIGLLLAVIYSKRLGWLREWVGVHRWVVVAVLVAAVGLGTFERVVYGLSSIRNNAAVLAAADAFPLYLPTTFRTIAKRMGMKVDRDPTEKMSLDAEASKLSYPLRPLVCRPDAAKYNIVWLAVESLRADTVTPEVMPNIHAFAQESNWFRQHYSGGNGTRMGVFSMFYGLYGNYWFPFLNNLRGPVLIDFILQNGYQVEMYTSATFTYPEFDKTVFARVPAQHLHEYTVGEGWERDRKNVTDMLDSIDGRDPSRPFMTFMFFESPHARYHFPPEDEVFKPYLEEFNYATTDVQKDIALIKNRYLNSCHHLDSQVARVIAYLKEHNLLDSTILIITGDHGEEFMERGFWGHGSKFNDEQTRPPLIIHAPGKTPSQVTRMTSHLDLPATVLTLLGVTNPTRDYTLGHDLYGPVERDFTVLADWYNLVYVDHEYKAVLPFKAFGAARQSVTTKADEPVKDPAAFYQSRQAQLFQLMRDSTMFSRSGAGKSAP